MDGVLAARHLKLENAMAELAVLREQIAMAEQVLAVREQRGIWPGRLLPKTDLDSSCQVRTSVFR